jgi:hypothetical protein
MARLTASTPNQKLFRPLGLQNGEQRDNSEFAGIIRFPAERFNHDWRGFAWVLDS